MIARVARLLCRKFVLQNRDLQGKNRIFKSQIKGQEGRFSL